MDSFKKNGVDIHKSAIKIQSHVRINVEYETGNDLIMGLSRPHKRWM